MAAALYSGGELICPWRNVSGVQADGSVVYYASSHEKGCLPCLPTSSPKLTRQVLQPPNEHSIPPGSSLTGSRVLLIVNPHAGTGKGGNAKAIIAMQQIFSEAGLDAEVRTTERAGHAKEIIFSYGNRLTDFAAVCTVGGDGTLHEVLNAFVEIPQNSAINCRDLPPLAVAPMGSGNAIAVSTGILSIQHAALNIVHALRVGRAEPMAIMQYRRVGETVRDRVAIGGTQWGLPADVDMGTEHLRWMGDTRFDLGALLHIVQKKSARARIKVTVDPDQHKKVSENLNAKRKLSQKAKLVDDSVKDIGDNTYIIDTNFVMCAAWNAAFIADGLMVTPYARATELNMFDFVLFRAGPSRLESLRMFLNVADGSALAMSDAILYFKATRVEFESLEGEFLTLDGESIPVEPFVLEMAPEDGQLRLLDSFSEPLQ